MKKLSKDLKRILAALAHQDAGEYLSMHEKMAVLGYGPESRKKPLTSASKKEIKPVTRRIAFITDSRGTGSPLDYAIEAATRQDANIDLLVHGTADSAKISALENQIREAGLESHRVPISVNVIDGIVNYINSHPSLIFLVSIPEDSAARALMEKVIPKHGNRLFVPLVLIEDRSSAIPIRQSVV